MQFVIARNSLQKELAFVQGIVERKNTIPVLANILIESAGEDAIRISGTDLDVTIRCDADAQEMVGCGRAFPDERVVIADPASLRRLDPGQIGEIWAAGPNIAPGYWRNPEASAEAFMARLGCSIEQVEDMLASAGLDQLAA